MQAEKKISNKFKLRQFSIFSIHCFFLQNMKQILKTCNLRHKTVNAQRGEIISCVFTPNIFTRYTVQHNIMHSKKFSGKPG